MTTLFFILGLLFGSFVTAFVWRLHAARDFVHGRSQCESCKHTLEVLDLIPVISWLVLRGRCRHCQQPISWQYPLIELITGAAFALSYAFWPFLLGGIGAWLIFALWLISTVLFISLAVYDAKWMLLPDKIMWPLVLVSLAAVAIQTSQFGVVAIKNSAAGVVIGFGFFYLLSVVSKGRWIGGGDVKFGLIMGLWLGALKTVVALLLAFYGAALVVLPLLLLKKVSRKSHVPFGPFLIAATFLAQLIGQNIIDWYSGLFLGGLV